MTIQRTTAPDLSFDDPQNGDMDRRQHVGQTTHHFYANLSFNRDQEDQETPCRQADGVIF
ncbi:hypothetical protein A0U93_14455 [Neoasaia chiangmaiensis]|uniref:Uncharacterized protein n=1 Tax=Neoasaia chiangmaiensis TaxID=320497 RepID=A0A1U9KSV6_9PROT|nr:hypothetical protein A0U93_14455 [Neoasaia chiangmaiensis]